MRVTLYSQPGSASKPNEDFAVATPSSVVVLDGLTAPADLGTGCVHGTPWFVAQLAGSLSRILSIATGGSLQDALAEAVKEVACSHGSSCDLGHPGTPSATVAALRESAAGTDWLVLSDATLVLDTGDGIEVVTDDRVEDVARDEREATRQHFTGSPIHRQLMRRMVAEQRRHRNQPGGYWVAGSDPAAAYQSLTGSAAARALRRAAVLTDGASRFTDLFGLGDWAELLDIVERHGPQDLISQVRDAEALDPDGERWPRYKRSDDATAAMAVFEQPVAGS